MHLVSQGQRLMIVGLMLSSVCTSSISSFLGRSHFSTYISFFAPYHRIKSTEAAADESEAARAIAEAQKAAHEYETVVTVGHHEHVQHVHTSTEV